MFGASRTSAAKLADHLASVYAESQDAERLSQAGNDMFSVVGVLTSERSLRATLADPAITVATKQEIVARLFGGKISDLAEQTLANVVSLRWSSDSDMVDATEEAGDSLLLMAAESEGRIDGVEEELFRFGRAIDANADLQMALTDPAAGPDLKAGIVNSLLAGKADQTTISLVSEVAGNLRGRRIQDAIARLSELAAARRGQIIAEVKAAVPLSDEQQTRLAAALARLHGRSVELNIDVDPSVVGGIEVRVGDEVIDGTAATKLEQARRRLTS